MSQDSSQDSPPNLDLEFQAAIEMCQSGQLDLAKKKLIKLLEQNPAHDSVLHQLGLVYILEKNFDDAGPYLASAIALNPEEFVYRLSYGNFLQHQGRLADALAQYIKAVSLCSTNLEVYFNLGLVQQKLNQHCLAIDSFSKAIELNRQWESPFLNRGNSFMYLGQYEQAMSDYNQAIVLNHLSPLAYINKGILCFKKKQIQEAFSNFSIGLKLDSQNAQAFQHFGVMLNKVDDFAGAARAYFHAYALSPSENFALGSGIYQKCLIADWGGIGSLIEELDARLRRYEAVAEPFGYIGVSQKEENSFIAAKIFSQRSYPAQAAAPRAFQRRPKIRIGYLGGEFYAQATSYLLTGVLEHHDKTHFEVTAFDSGRDDGSVIRKRQAAAFNEMINIAETTDEDVVNLIKRHEIDILIDLNGFFGNARQGVLAHRPSPVQISFLGWPGTMGVDYVDYLIADHTVIPQGSEPFYAEKIVRLPNCYQCNDDKRQISPKVFKREELNLPAEGFVFCCFNNTYKILPETFDSWIRILNRVKGSVLWLFDSHPAAVENLRREAKNRGLNPGRLIFAKHLPNADHLARHRLADLFIDTLPYNAHTTASDALWAGLPVLTLIGNTFPGRVAASLLKSIEMPELIATTIEEYEAKAIDLANHPEKLASLKVKLAKHRMSTPLFNTKLYTRYFEEALSAIYERSQAGLPPAHIEIKA